MKKLLYSAALTLLVSSTVFATANSKALVLNADSLHWLKANGLPGAEVAVLYGNPEKKGAFIARVKLPANFTVPLHSHAINEYDTVISGTLYLGTGNKAEAKEITAPAGSFVMIPAKLKHYASTKEETILQINGMGPWGMIYKKH